jgi:hypothetical protein
MDFLYNFEQQNTMIFIPSFPKESNVRRILRIKSVYTVCTVCTVMTNPSLEGSQIEQNDSADNRKH